MREGQELRDEGLWSRSLARAVRDVFISEFSALRLSCRTHANSLLCSCPPRPAPPSSMLPPYHPRARATRLNLLTADARRLAFASAVYGALRRRYGFMGSFLVRSGGPRPPSQSRVTVVTYGGRRKLHSLAIQHVAVMLMPRHVAPLMRRATPPSW